MASSFKSKSLFNSGPHRFALARQGHLILQDLFFGVTTPGSTPFGLLELDVVVTGRLVAGSEAALWTLRDAITAELEETPTSGVLVDEHGRTWNEMVCIRYEEGDRVDRGRAWSLAYVATFRDFKYLSSALERGGATPTIAGVGMGGAGAGGAGASRVGAR